MAKFELKLPKMGESVAEATITTWLKEVGDTIELDDAVVEIATDKVDSEVPSEVEGVLVEKLFDVDDVVQVGQTIAIIETEGDIDSSTTTVTTSTDKEEETDEVAQIEQEVEAITETVTNASTDFSEGSRFYSPLVKNIASEEGIGLQELEAVQGTGKDGRVTKNDILQYVEDRKAGKGAVAKEEVKQEVKKQDVPVKKEAPKAAPVVASGEDEIIEMTRMGKLIAHHMVESVQTSAHVQSFIEADVTNIWNWRKKVKDEFKRREGENITFTPIFMEAIAKTLKDFPLMNISVADDKIIKKKNIL